MPRKTGQRAIKNISEIKNLANEIDKILNNIDASKLSDDMAAIKDLSEGINDTWKNSNQYSEINKDLENRKIKMQQMHRDEALEAFKIWKNKEDKIKY